MQCGNDPELFAGSHLLPGHQAHDAIERESHLAEHCVRTYAFGESMGYRCNAMSDFNTRKPRSMSASDLYRLTASAGARFLTLVSSASSPLNSSAFEIASSSTD